MYGKLQLITWEDNCNWLQASVGMIVNMIVNMTKAGAVVSYSSRMGRYLICTAQCVHSTPTLQPLECISVIMRVHSAVHLSGRLAKWHWGVWQ